MARNAKAREKQKRDRQSRRRLRRKADENKFQMQDALRWLVDERIFTGIVLHGNTNWKCFDLVCLTLIWVWSTTPQLTEAFVDARGKTEKLFGSVAVTTYQGLMKALVACTPKLMPALQLGMQELMSKIGGKHMYIGRWIAIAIDGSKETAARTVSNELAFRAKNYGQGKNAKNRKRKLRMGTKKSAAEKTEPSENTKPKKPLPLPPPQVWLTMMWHMGLGLPWCWKLGPSNASERNHVKEILKTTRFLSNTIFVGDAGFVGYDFWKMIMEREHHFLVRVGANVNLLSGLCEHQRDSSDIVYCWPKDAMKAGRPPLRLRLVKCKIGKKENVWLLTSVLNSRELTNKEMVRLYTKRWGVELQFRALKQTFNRRKLRCRSYERVFVEIEWSVFGMAAVELMALKEQLKSPDFRTEKLSFSQSLTVVRHCLNNLTDCPAFIDDMRTGLKGAVIDDYERKKLKSGRYKPNKKSKPSCGEPKVELANDEQCQKLRDINLQNAA